MGLTESLKKCCTVKRLKRFFPVANWGRNYQLSWLRYDILGGITVGLTLVPQALAYAQLAKLPPEYGLYTSYVGCLVYTIFGTARDVNLGPASVMSLLTGDFGEQNPLGSADPTYALLLSFVSGVILCTMGLLQLGFLVNLFSIPVISGFTSAASLVIIISQLKSFLGLEDVPRTFIHAIINCFSRLDETNLADLCCGLTALAFLLFMQFGGRFLLTKIKFKPVNIVLQFLITTRNILVVIVSSLIGYLLINSSSLTLTGKLPSGFPPPRLPQFVIRNETDGSILKDGSAVFADLRIGFIMIPLIIALEQFAVAKALARKNDYRVDASQELFACGLANLIGSLFNAYPSTASVTRSALNSQCQVKSPLTSAVTAVLVIVSISALTSTFQFIPKAALAAVIMSAALHMFDYNIVRGMWYENKPDLVPLAASFLCTLFVGLEYGILIGMVISLCMYLGPVIHLKFYIQRMDLSTGKVLVVKLQHGLKYPSVDRFVDKTISLVERETNPVILDCQFITSLDYTALQGIKQIARDAGVNDKFLIMAHLTAKLEQKVFDSGVQPLYTCDTVARALRILSVNLSAAHVKQNFQAHPSTSVTHNITHRLRGSGMHLSYVGGNMDYQTESSDDEVCDDIPTGPWVPRNKWVGDEPPEKKWKVVKSVSEWSIGGDKLMYMMSDDLDGYPTNMAPEYTTPGGSTEALLLTPTDTPSSIANNNDSA